MENGFPLSVPGFDPGSRLAGRKGTLTKSAQLVPKSGEGACQVAVLAIRAHKRFGVSRGVRVHRKGGSALGGLLIELSLEGCRISNLNSALFAFEDCVEIEIEGCQSLRGCVRWNHGGLIGLRLTQPLHHAELIELISACRSEPALPQARRA